MLDRDSIVYGAQLAFIDLAEEIYDKQVAGDDYDCLEDKFLLVHNYLLVLQRTPGQEREDLILDCLTKQLNLYDLPIAPSLRTVSKPTIVFGPREKEVVSGPPGRDGSDANINVVPLNVNTTVTESIVDGVKTFAVGSIPYVAPLGNLSVSASTDQRKIFEVGENVSIQVVVDTIEGSADVLTRELYANATELILGELTGEELVLHANVNQDTTYYLSFSDAEQTITLEDSVNFYYPFLYTSGTSLTYGVSKIVSGKQNQSVVFNGVSTKYHFGYPTEYGTLLKILDQNDDDVTSSFEMNEVSISSTGYGSLDWTKTYKVYSTIDITDITNKQYKFIFNE